MSVIRSVEELEALYGEPAEPARVKEVDRITPHYRQLIEASPFFVLATSGPEGLDCSPARRSARLRAHRRRADAHAARPARQQPGGLAPQHRPRRARGAPVPDPRLRHHPARERPRPSGDRPRPARLLRGGRQGAAFGHRVPGGDDLLPMRPRHHAGQALGRGKPGGAGEPAEPRAHPGGAHGGAARRGGTRPRPGPSGRAPACGSGGRPARVPRLRPPRPCGMEAASRGRSASAAPSASALP